MLARIRSWWSAVTHRSRFEDEMRTEMAFHVQAYVDDLIANGVAPAEAQRRARMEFGTVDAIKDDCRQSRGLQLVDTTAQDLRYAWRMMRKTPGFTAAAIVFSDGAFPVQAFSYGRAAFGFQFHPEITYAQVHRWTGHNPQRLTLKGARERGDHIAGHMVHAPKVHARLAGFLHRWARADLTTA